MIEEYFSSTHFGHLNCNNSENLDNEVFTMIKHESFECQTVLPRGAGTV
jgi:hypothetical protein